MDRPLSEERLKYWLDYFKKWYRGHPNEEYFTHIIVPSPKGPVVMSIKEPIPLPPEDPNAEAIRLIRAELLRKEEEARSISRGVMCSTAESAWMPTGMQDVIDSIRRILPKETPDDPHFLT